MSSYYTKYVDSDIWDFEKLYKQFEHQDVDLSDQSEFPRVYKLEFLQMMYLLFNDNGFYSRSEHIIQIFEHEYDTCADENKLDMAYRYIT